MRRQSGMFKAVVDTAKEAFYTSNESKQLEDFASPSEEEESNDGGFDIFSAGDVVAQTDFGSVIRPCGLKRDGKREAMSQLREKRKRIKAEKTIQHVSLKTLFQRMEKRNPRLFFQTIHQQQGISFPM